MTNQNDSRKKLNKKTLFFGLNSALMTLIVIALVGVINFLSVKHPEKIDLTKNKLHTFSDQTAKVVKGLKSELKATLFGLPATREKHRTLIENYKKHSSNFKFELVDPNKEPTRAKSAGIKKMDTLVLEYQGKTSKLEEISEEKVTNEIIKLTKETKQLVCFTVGHGEQSVSQTSAEGLGTVKQNLEEQSYSVKEINLPQENSIPADCSSLVMLGVNKALFPNEVKLLDQYLAQGGRLILGIDAVIQGSDQTTEIKALLKGWGVEVKSGLIIEPISRMLGVDASVALIAQYNSDQPIVKDFKEQAYFPFSRPIEPMSQLEGLTAKWLAKTTPKSWSELDTASLNKGQVTFNSGVDIQGPLNVAVAVSGKKKDSQASRETRLVVFGSSAFASNNFMRFGGNSDLILNSIAWVLEDESMISIRAKDDDNGKIELSQNEGVAIFWISVIIVPLLIALAGIVIWVRRKKL